MNFQKAMENIKSNMTNLKKVAKDKLNTVEKNYSDQLEDKQNTINSQTTDMEKLSADLLKDFAEIETNISTIEAKSVPQSGPVSKKK